MPTFFSPAEDYLAFLSLLLLPPSELQMQAQQKTTTDRVGYTQQIQHHENIFFLHFLLKSVSREEHFPMKMKM